jgi:chloramphenicol-sensitive protein RarD
MPASQHPQAGGLPMALGAYLIWGLLPLYLRLVNMVPPFEFVGWRVIFTLPLCLLFIQLRGQWPDLRAAIASPRTLVLLMLSSTLIGINWLIYIAAIQAGHVLATSLGYYINPLMNVLFGTVLLKERLNRVQWSAVILAGLGVSLLAWGSRDMLWISLALAISFACYGLVRKLTPVGSLPGLTIEATVLMLRLDLLIAFGGVVTAVPLLMFAIAARRLDLSTLGFVQFLSPTLVFFLGLFVFGEPLRPVQLACFLTIWAAAGLFVWDLVSRRRSAV